MNYLLDTHAFLWLAHDSGKLSPSAHEIIADTNNELFLSLVSVWEIQIKSQLGKLELKTPLADLIQEQAATNHIQLLPLLLEHILGLSELPTHHRDPFDRLLISQSRHENLPIISSDSQVSQYPVKVIW